jgi:hypothetical protein
MEGMLASRRAFRFYLQRVKDKKNIMTYSCIVIGAFYFIEIFVHWGLDLAILPRNERSLR